MGGGASKGLLDNIADANDQDIKAALSGLSSDDLQRLSKAIKNPPVHYYICNIDFGKVPGAPHPGVYRMCNYSADKDACKQQYDCDMKIGDFVTAEDMVMASMPAEFTSKPGIMYPGAPGVETIGSADGFKKCVENIAFLFSSKGMPTTYESLTRSGKPELLYFNLPGRSLAVRVAMFHTFGKDGWVDKNVSFDEYMPIKKAYMEGEPKELCAAPHLPQLTLPSGRKVAEAVPISKWAATAKGLSPLYPQDPEKQFQVDEAIEIIYDCSRAPGGKDEEEKKVNREAFAAGPLKVGLKLYTQKLSASDGPFLLGSQLTLADLWVYFVINMIKVGSMDFVDAKMLDDFPKVMENFKAVCESDLLKKYKEAYADAYTFES